MSIDYARVIRVANGDEPADLLLRGGRVFNVFTREVEDADVAIAEGLIAAVGDGYTAREVLDLDGGIVCPGFIDAHIHLESSMVLPAEFARAVVPHGTTTVITDPHEIANVMGADGIRYMLAASEGLPLDVQMMLPSCVPATPLDESGATLSAADLRPFYGQERVLGLAEMMNYVGVVGGDAEVLRKLADARAHGVPIDGHAPSLTGKGLSAYLAAGIGTDHECDNSIEAREKLARGGRILVREGTAAHNLAALVELLHPPTDARCAFATDDKHPDALLRGGHIDALLRKAVALGADPASALCAATINAAEGYGLRDRGAVAPGRRADLAVITDMVTFSVTAVVQNGRVVARDGAMRPFSPPTPPEALAHAATDTFHLKTPLSTADFAAGRCGVLRLIPEQLRTDNAGFADAPDVSADRLTLAVIERHHATGHIGLGYVEGFGLTRGAIATSIAHDSHNLIVIGCDPADMALAANHVAAHGGGIAVAVNGEIAASLPLTVAGLMSDRPLAEVDAALEEAKAVARSLGVAEGVDPFMSLSFLSLPVIPSLRVTTRGVFDVDRWQYL